jgi:hypothetical protein
MIRLLVMSPTPDNNPIEHQSPRAAKFPYRWIKWNGALPSYRGIGVALLIGTELPAGPFGRKFASEPKITRTERLRQLAQRHLLARLCLTKRTARS